MSSAQTSSTSKIAVLGGGVAGSTIALRLAEIGIDVTLIEQGRGLVNGPPFCHLHAGGSFYREISDQQCLTLLQQSIATARVYRQSINLRPTVVALPCSDKGQPKDLLPRLKKLQAAYSDLITADPLNEVLGKPAHYYQAFEREQVEQLARMPLPEHPKTGEEWMIPVAKQLDLNKLQFPLILVQEYGLSSFRVAATATLASQALKHCTVQKYQQVTNIENCGDNWCLESKDRQSGKVQIQRFDYLINACGFRSGEIDDMLAAPRERFVEFKAAYVANWAERQGHWPEVVFYGERGTPDGMAQLTPYSGGIFQLHGMTEDITLFNDGLVSSSTSSAQPKLPERYIKKIEQCWPKQSAEQRTLGSIEHMAQFIPSFATANTAAKPLFGAQQIPGSDPSLRAAAVSFYGSHYARTEIVKASSALSAADDILQKLFSLKLLPEGITQAKLSQHHFPLTQSLNPNEISKLGQIIAEERGYPKELAQFYA